ncbi:MAG: glycine cleavage T C-terminal barrel domain-containing protein, partial [Planctomycetota bacterium]
TSGPIHACGLGARDTLRIEAGLPLYGQELTGEIDPIGAGFGWAVGKEHDFSGSDRIRQIAEDGPEKVLVGLELDGRRTARTGQAVMADLVPIGEVTSGCLSPTLGKSIAMAYVASTYAGIGELLGVDFKREVVRCKVVPLPFYKRPS